jgi:hypothetical protein
MRQTGRTSRIVNFAIDQLYSVGEVIVTDHIAFEFSTVSQAQLIYFVDKVKDTFEKSFHSKDWRVIHDFHKIGETPVIRFKLERKPERSGKTW